MQNKHFFLFVIFLSVILNSNCKDDKKENSIEKLVTWHYKGVDNIWRKTYVPDAIHTSLQRDTLMYNLYYEMEFLNNKWIDTVNWEYRTYFQVSNELKNEHYELILKGITGVADVYLNDSLIVKTDNMFIEWKTDISDIVVKGKNIIYIKFENIKKTNETLNNNSDVKLPFKGFEMFRIARYFTDTTMGFYYIPLGFWKDVVIKKWEDLTVEDVFFQTVELEKEKYAKIKATYLIKSDINTNINLTIRYKNINLTNKKINIDKGTHSYEVDFEITNPQLWWSHDLGTPYLYNLKSTFTKNEEVLAENEVLFGIKKISIDTLNNSFLLKLNDVPVTLKIIEYLPLDIFWNLTKEENYIKVAQDLKLANFNMLRISEKGIYEQHFLYDALDKAGILVWQDFMFPCKIIDSSEHFLKNIENEINFITSKLRKHTCIAFWSGSNNINEQYAYYKNKLNYSSEDSLIIYQTNNYIFKDLIPKTISQNSNLMYFENMNFKSIKKIKEKTPEYPNILTIRTFTQPNNRHTDSKVIKAHQKPYNATALIKNALSNYSEIPQDFNNFIYLNQCFSAQEYQKTLNECRFDNNYTGFNCGLYNDYNPIISYSAVDYKGYWKGKMFGLKNALSKLQVRVTEKKGWVNIDVRSDFNNDLQFDFYFKLYTFDGNILWRRNILNQNIETLKSKKYFSFNIGSELSKAGRNFCVFKIDIYLNQELYSEKYYYFTDDKFLKLKKPNIKQKFYVVEDGYVIELTTDYLAKNVYVYTEKTGTLSDNFFDLIPGETKKITFFSKTDIYSIESSFKTIDFTMKNDKNIFIFQ